MPQQRLMISDIVANLDRTGVKTESLVYDVFKYSPDIIIVEGSKYSGNKGLDLVIQFIDSTDGIGKTMIIDSKQLAKSGSVSLDSKAAGGFLQLSNSSLEVIIERLDKSPAALAVERAMENGTLLKSAAYVDKKTGSLKFINLDIN